VGEVATESRDGRAKSRGALVLLAAIASTAALPLVFAWYGWFAAALLLAVFTFLTGAAGFALLLLTALPKVATARPYAQGTALAIVAVAAAYWTSGLFLAPSVLDASVEATRERGAALHARLRALHAARGRWPSELAEVESDGRGPAQRPTFASQFDYDGSTGELSFESGLFPFSRVHVLTGARFGWTERETSD
jgi:hypothetical protein